MDSNEEAGINTRNPSRKVIAMEHVSDFGKEPVWQKSFVCLVRVFFSCAI